MLKKVVAVAVVAGAAAVSWGTPANAAATVCYSATVTVNGETVVNEASCVEA